MPSLGYQRILRGKVIVRGTVAIDPPSLTTGTKGTVSITIAGVKVTDIVILEPPVALEAGLVFQGVRAKAGGADVDIANPTAGTIDGASRTWGYKVIKAS
jgi:hypothetical protein